MRRLILAALILGALCLPASASANTDTPEAPCNVAHVMDLHINDHGVWFECSCEQLRYGVVCDWYRLGPAMGDATRRHRLRVKPQIIRKPIPAVVL